MESLDKWWSTWARRPLRDVGGLQEHSLDESAASTTVSREAITEPDPDFKEEPQRDLASSVDSELNAQNPGGKSPHPYGDEVEGVVDLSVSQPTQGALEDVTDLSMVALELESPVEHVPEPGAGVDGHSVGDESFRRTVASLAGLCKLTKKKCAALEEVRMLTTAQCASSSCPPFAELCDVLTQEKNVRELEKLVNMASHVEEVVVSTALRLP